MSTKCTLTDVAGRGLRAMVFYSIFVTSRHLLVCSCSVSTLHRPLASIVTVAVKKGGAPPPSWPECSWSSGPFQCFSLHHSPDKVRLLGPDATRQHWGSKANWHVATAPHRPAGISDTLRLKIRLHWAGVLPLHKEGQPGHKHGSVDIVLPSKSSGGPGSRQVEERCGVQGRFI